MKKLTSFFIAAVISAAALNISASADTEYALRIKLEDTKAVKGEQYAVVPMNILENSGIACIGTRLITDNDISIKGFTVKDDFAGEFTPDGSSFIWITKDTMNIYSTGTFADVYADISNVKYPGVYSISFSSETNTTMAINEDVADIDAEWVGGNIIVNGNEEDIAMSDVLGDMDGSGEVTSYDALLVLKNVTGQYDFDVKGSIKGDVDYDEKITSNDALNILQMTTGAVSDFSGAVSAGIYLDEKQENISHTVYYKDMNGSVVLSD